MSCIRKNRLLKRGSGCIPVDIVHYFGPESISGIIYIGGALLSLNLSAQCRHPLFKPLVPLICSSDAQVAAKSAVPFVDSCVADPAALSYSTKLSLVGGFGLQPPIIRYFSLNREQDDSRWREQARHIPVVIIQGTEDTHCMYEVMIGLAKSIYDQVEVHLMHGVGHSPHIERPQEANRHILAFVRRSISQSRVSSQSLPVPITTSADICYLRPVASVNSLRLAQGAF